MKKIFCLLILCILFFDNVKANTTDEAIFYSNDLGTKFSEKEYNFINQMFYEGYQKYITKDELEKMRISNIIKDEIEKIEIPVVNEYSLNNGGRVLNLTKSCGTTCLVAMNISWNSIPQIKEYDVLGFRIENVEIKSTNSVKISANNYSKTYSYNKSSKEGRGFSIVLPNANNIKISASIYATKGGKVYGAYQHAKEKVSLDVSKLYNFSSSGSGKVMQFYGKAFGKYDDINGLNISV